MRSRPSVHVRFAPFGLSWSRAGLLGWSLLASLLALAAHGAEPMVGIRSLAMGESLRALPQQSEALLLNPAGLEQKQQFHVSGFYSLRLPSMGHFLHASISDSVTNRYFALGLYYNYLHETPQFAFRLRTTNPGEDQQIVGAAIVRDGHESGTSLALPVGQRMSLGATLKYAHYSLVAKLGEEQLGAGRAFDDSRVDRENNVDLGSIGSVVSFDVGMVLRPFAGLHLGVVGQNLWPHGSELPTMLGIGLGYAWDDRLILALDTVINFTGHEACTDMTQTTCTETSKQTTVRVGLGGEYSIAGKVPVRLGYMYDDWLAGHHVTAGLGYVSGSSRWAIDVGLRQRVSPSSETVLLIGLRVLSGGLPSDGN